MNPGEFGVSVRVSEVGRLLKALLWMLPSSHVGAIPIGHAERVAVAFVGYELAKEVLASGD